MVSFSPGTGSQFALLPPQNATGNFTKIVQRVPVRIHIDAGPEPAGAGARTFGDRRSIRAAAGSAKRVEREYVVLSGRRSPAHPPRLAPSAKAGAPARGPQRHLADWIAVVAGTLGALMATLDISIVNSALPQIQGEIGATGTEAPGSRPAICVGNRHDSAGGVAHPAVRPAHFPAGQRHAVHAFSVMCGLSHSLPQMIVGRIGQGFTGGAMIPTAQTIVENAPAAAPDADRHDPVRPDRAARSAAGPGGGRLAGGAHRLELVLLCQLPVGVALVALLFAGLPKSPHDWHQFVNADWLGIIGLSAGLSSLTVVLEEGQRETGSTRG